MGPAKLVFLVIAAAAPLLLAVQIVGSYSAAEAPKIWINNDGQLGNAVMRPILIYDGLHYTYFSFAAGFICATTTTCDVYLFAVFCNYGDGTDDSLQVVWSANRDHPVREKATLEFTSDGNLVRDADGSHVWSSGSSGRSVTRMVINGNGNLVLSDQSDAAVWQSFDHPTDTLVPGQSLLQGTKLTAYTSPTNRTADQFYITELPDGLNVYYVEPPTSPQLYFSYQTKIGKIGNDPTKATLMDGSLSFILRPDMSDNFTLPAASNAQYMRLDSDGHLRLYEWSRYLVNWTVISDVLGAMGMDDCAYPKSLRGVRLMHQRAMHLSTPKQF